jgi:hypothetical protein
VTALRFPAEIAVGEVWWEDAREPGGWGHLLAIGVVQVPDGTAVSLSVNVVAEVTVGGQVSGWLAPAGMAPVGTGSMPAVPRRRRRARRARPAEYERSPERVTWRRGMPDSAVRNTRSIWGGPGEGGYSLEHGEEAVDLEFIGGLPADSVFSLRLIGDIVPASFPVVAHLAPGLRQLGVDLDDLGDDAPSVIAGLTGLESLNLSGGSASDDDPASRTDGNCRLDDHALSVIAGLPALEYLSLLGGAYTEQGLQQLGRLRTLRHLHVEREDLTAAMFQFAATMPSLTRLTGPDEFGEDGPMPPAEVDQLRAMLPHVSMD